MMEHYEKACLPIFPIANNYTCSFISLGDIAFFVASDDRPSWMPPVCLFSPKNHAPEREFIKRLPYSKGDSEHPGLAVQGYSFWVGHDGKPMQTGVSPDRTADGGGCQSRLPCQRALQPRPEAEAHVRGCGSRKARKRSPAPQHLVCDSRCRPRRRCANQLTRQLAHDCVTGIRTIAARRPERGDDNS